MALFKAYDIRGTVPDQLNEEIAYRIGYFLARERDATKAVVGMDVRTSSPAMSHALCSGLQDAGCDVQHIGTCTTPMVYYAVGSLGLDLGVMTTASHNPPHYNGFKVCGPGAIPLSGHDGLGPVEARVFSSEETPKVGNGSLVEQPVIDGYREHILSFVDSLPNRKIVVDCANGVVGPVFDAVFNQSPMDVTRLYFEPDGTFPNHEPNPLADENIEDLSRLVRGQGADLGVAFDGDGDRCCFVDENGHRISSDLMTGVLAQDILDVNPGASIVYDLRSSRATAEAISAAGGTPVRERVGHAFMKARMRELDSPFGGELSGHYYFKDHWFCDSALLGFVLFMNRVARHEGPVSALIEPLRGYASTGEVNFEVSDKDAAIERISGTFPDGEQDRLDGITVQYEDWWLNVRKSNTEPLLRLNLEAETSDLMQERFEQVRSILQS